MFFISLKVTKITGKAEKAWKFLKDRAFYQSKCDKNYEKGRENMRILENSAFSQSKSDKNSDKGRENMKEGKEHGIDIYS